MGRTPCCSKVGMRKGLWKLEEDQVLLRHIQKHGEGNWRALPKQAGLLRCGKSCRLRWLNYLRPSTKRGNISEDEESLIVTLHSLLGNRWSLIAGRIPGRTDNEIKNYWNTHLSKKLVSKGLYPSTHKTVQLSCHSSSKDGFKEKCRSERKSHTTITELDSSSKETGQRIFEGFSWNTSCPGSSRESEENDLFRQNNSLFLYSKSHKSTMEQIASPSYSLTCPIYRPESIPSGFNKKTSFSSIDSVPLQAAACFGFGKEPLEDSTLRRNPSSNKIMHDPSSVDKKLCMSTDYLIDYIIQETDTQVKFDTESSQQLQSLSFLNEKLEIDELWGPMDQMITDEPYSSPSILSDELQEEHYLSDLFSNFYYTDKPHGSTAPTYETHKLKLLTDVNI
ncbi:hypothetical protein O6H91_08G008700 [Diphasiastrum complanatum]|nr:hypothetical protein O6H91_08G008700 [Diphasiastrum complanatum]